MFHLLVAPRVGAWIETLAEIILTIQQDNEIVFGISQGNQVLK